MTVMTSDTPAASLHPLLDCLNQWARQGGEGGLALSGALSIAVKTPAKVWCWAAVFRSDLVWCGAVEGVAPDSDAIWVLDESEAQQLLEGRVPHTGGRVFGDAALLEAFIARCCGAPQTSNDAAAP